MNKEDVRREYFDWLSYIACGERYSKQVSFHKLLKHLHDTTFVYSIPRDSNRAEDGVALRFRFIHENEYPDYYARYIDGECSVLEMILALSIRCEETIMDDPKYGDRKGQWFWGMIVSLGLGSMTDDRYDEQYVNDILTRFLNREYEENGHGGLFTVKNPPHDLRDVEIWIQMCYYLDTITA